MFDEFPNHEARGQKTQRPTEDSSPRGMTGPLRRSDVRPGPEPAQDHRAGDGRAHDAVHMRADLGPDDRVHGDRASHTVATNAPNDQYASAQRLNRAL